MTAPRIHTGASAREVIDGTAPNGEVSFEAVERSMRLRALAAPDLAASVAHHEARAERAEESAALWQRGAEAHRAEVVETRKSRDHWRDCEERQRAATAAALAHAAELERALSTLRATAAEHLTATAVYDRARFAPMPHDADGRRAHSTAVAEATARARAALDALRALAPEVPA